MIVVVGTTTTIFARQWRALRSPTELPLPTVHPSGPSKRGSKTRCFGLENAFFGGELM